MNVSYHLAIHMDGQDQTFGTENSCKVFEEHKAKFHDALVIDALVDEDCQEKTEDDDLKAVASAWVRTAKANISPKIDE